jgi:hypothetical protein
MLRGMHEVEAQKAKIAILAAIRVCRKERVKEELYQSPSSRSVHRRATTIGTNGRMSIRESELRTAPCERGPAFYFAVSVPLFRFPR